MKKVLVTISALAIAGLFLAAMIYSGRREPVSPVDTTSPATSGEVAEAPASSAPDAPAPADDNGPATPAGTAAPQAPSAPASAEAASTGPIPGLTPLPPETVNLPTLGSHAYPERDRIVVTFSSYGAAVREMHLTGYRQKVRTDPDTLEPGYLVHGTVSGGSYFLYPMAARAVTINGNRIDLQAQQWNCAPGEAAGSARFWLTLVDAQGRPVAEIIRTYLLPAGRYELECHQQIVNRSDAPLNVIWEQNLQGDMPEDGVSFMGDRRQFTAGYFDPAYNPSRTRIYVADAHAWRTHLLDEASSSPGYRTMGAGAFISDLRPFWPNSDIDPSADIAWIASSNRYFSVVVHAPVQEPASDTAGKAPGVDARLVTPLDEVFAEFGMQVIGTPSKNHENQGIMLLGRTPVTVIAPGESQPIDLVMFAGPRQRHLLESFPYNALHLSSLLVYELGCTFCTFQPVARGLLAFLTLIERVTFDWGIAIIVLVLVVRLLLHPITKRSQVHMAKFSKQMSTLQPEIEKLKARYGSDPQRFQAEQAKLMREKGMHPGAFLGCLPMFLQTPIWIALYAMLYYAIELRHEPAFYGIFQAVSGGAWGFLADLSAPDHFLKVFDQPVEVPLIITTFKFQYINLLPLLWGVMMFIQQRLMAPPATTDQQRTQQKMMSYMSLLFPLFLYNYPSGLTMYMLASSAAGSLDSWIVRKHIREQEARGELYADNRKGKNGDEPTGFMGRFMKMMEEKQKAMEKARGVQRPGDQRGGRRKR